MSATLQPAAPGSMTVASGAFAVLPIGFGYYPKEGSRAIAVQYNWTLTAGYAEDLSQLVARGVETSIQAVFIDNSTCSQSVTLTVGGTGQVLICPSSSQGMFPIFFTGTPNYQISVPQAGVGTTRLTLLNVPGNAAGIWPATAANSRTLLPLDATTVAVGGTAVVALLAGHRTGGGWISNPSTASTTLGINEIGPAIGTTSLGNTTFIVPGQTYNLTPSGNPVSVIASDSGHAFSGMGYL